MRQYLNIMKSKNTIIVTGASGFIGKQLVNRLLLDGFKVFGITRHDKPPYCDVNLTWISWLTYKGDISEANNISAVVNLVTTFGYNNESWNEILESNVTLPLALFKHAIKLGATKIINADSFFGKPKYNKYQYLKNYTRSKKILIDLSKPLTEEYKIDFINLRLEHVFGANDGPHKFVSKLIRDFQSKKTKIELTDGNQKRDFIYIDDVVEAFICVLKNSSNQGFFEYEVGTGESIKLKEFCIALANAFGIDADIFQFGMMPQRTNEIMNSSADIRDLKLIGWSPKWNLTQAVSDLKAKS